MADDFSRAADGLRQITPQVRAALPGAAEAGIDVIKPEVQAQAPRDDGALVNSIRDEAGDRGRDSASHGVIVGVFYARFVEDGHGGPAPAPAHPFFRPAIDLREDEAKRAVVGEIEKAVTRATGLA